MKTLKVKKLSDRAVLPKRNISTDAGLDIFAAEDVFIPVGRTVRIPTDIAVNITEGYYGLVCDRSSMGARGLRTGAGVIDAGYNGHLCVVLHNLNNMDDSSERMDGYQVRAGDKIAQLVVQPVSLPEVEEVKEFERSERGSNGFGSSGR